jgi:hypothetical protein
MVGAQSPGVAGSSRGNQGFAQAIQKIISVQVILEDLSAFDSSKDEMMEGTGHVDSGSSGHGHSVPKAFSLSTYKSMAVPILDYTLEVKRLGSWPFFLPE